MSKRTLPIYNINDFHHNTDEKNFYAETFKDHLKKHSFITSPHKHDFYLVVLFTKGSGKHEIDFRTYDIKPGSVFLLSPGQTHNWKLSADIDGFIFFHTKTFYDINFVSKKIPDFPFYSSIHNDRLINLKKTAAEKITGFFREITAEYNGNQLMKFQKLLSLTDLFYIELSRFYLPQKQIEFQNKNYLSALKKLEGFIDINFKKIKSPAIYAGMMNMGEKHLNRICKTSLNKTTTEIIADRVILEAKRLLVHSNQSVKEVAGELGYFDSAYFSRLFKKNCGESPKEFLKKYPEK